MHVAIGQCRASRLSFLSPSEYQSRDSAKYLPTERFSSPQLIQDLIQEIQFKAAKKNSIKKPEQNHQQTVVHKLIHKVEQVFLRMMEKLNKAKIDIISGLVCLNEETTVKSRQDLIQKELERCRKNIVESKFSSKLLDEFAYLLYCYKNLAERNPSELDQIEMNKIAKETESNLEDYTKDITLLTKKIEHDILALTQENMRNSNFQLQELAEEDREKKFEYVFKGKNSLPGFEPEGWVCGNKQFLRETKLPMHIPDAFNEATDLGVLAHLNNKEYLILLINKENLRSELEVIAYHKNSKRHSKIKIKTAFANTQNTTETMRLRYLESNGLIVLFDGEKVSLLSMVGKKLVKVLILRKIMCKCIELIDKGRKVVFVVNDANFESSSMIETMDILTRKIERQKTLNKIITNCVYNKKRDFLALSSNGEILIYNISREGYLGDPVLQIPTQNSSISGGRMFYQGNLLILSESFSKPGRRNIELPYESFQIISIDKRNKYQYQKCEICTKDEMWDECRDALVIPQMNKILLSFPRVTRSIVELNLKKHISKLLENMDYMELKDYRILAKNDEGNKLIVAKKDGIYEWNLSID